MTLHWLPCLSAPQHCGRPMFWSTWKGCWTCSKPGCDATA